MLPETISTVITCKTCHQDGSGKYCASCGTPYQSKRITVSSLVHEVFHFFTHLDKGFPYTLKKLIVSPGRMQRDYIEGHRARHQKPFAMFFICASVMALSLYWTNVALAHYFNAGDTGEAAFFNKYMVMLLMVSVPVLILITYALFFSSGYNLAEIGVFQLYTFSALLPIVALINLLKFIWPDLETRYIELPALLIYTAFSFVGFFRHDRKLWVILKSLICVGIFYVFVAFTQDYIVDHLLRK